MHLLGCDCAGFFSANYNIDQVVGMALKEFEDVEVAQTGFRDASASGLRLHFPFALPKELL